jgi:hypothetical protein
MHTRLKIILSVLGIAVVLLAAAVLLGWRKEIRTLASFRQVEDNPYLYFVDYQASYDLDEMVAYDVDKYGELLGYVIARGSKIVSPGRIIARMEKQLASFRVGGCTSFHAEKSGGGFLFGRNYDFFKNPTVVTLSHPKDGYASIAVSDMSFIGYSLKRLPTSFLRRVNCLAAIYAPLDGINEKGFCASIMALPHHLASQQDTPRHDVGTSTIVRLMLDRCATVEEAIALLGTVDVRHDATFKAAFHYMVADATGDCAVIEFDPLDGWNTMVVRKPDGGNHFQVTNHLLAPAYLTTEPDPAVGNTGSRSWWRLQAVHDFLMERGGRITAEEALECLFRVRWVDLPTAGNLTPGTQFHLHFKGLKAHLVEQPDKEFEDTQYSLVYDQSRITLSLRNWNDYDTAYDFSLNGK